MRSGRSSGVGPEALRRRADEAFPRAVSDRVVDLGFRGSAPRQVADSPRTSLQPAATGEWRTRPKHPFGALGTCRRRLPHGGLERTLPARSAMAAERTIRNDVAFVGRVRASRRLGREEPRSESPAR